MDLHRRLPLPHFTRLSRRPRRFALSLSLALAALLLLPALFAGIAPAMTDAAAFVPAPLDRALAQMGWRDDAYAFLADIGFYPPGSACAGAGCQAWYCDLVINGQCHERSGSGYVPSNPVGCLGNCGGGGGSCSSGRCANGDPYRCCAQPGQGGCGPILMGVRGSDCCGGAGSTPTPAPTPTPPTCDGERTQRFPPRGDYRQEPAHAVVVGQDPGVKGFTLRLDLHGGRAERWKLETKQMCTTGGGEYPQDCPSGPWEWRCVWEMQARYNDPIVKVEMAMRLHESTIAWIEGALAGRYRGAERQEPLPGVFGVWQGRAMSVREDWNYLPSDPGIHGGRILVTTAGTPISPPQQISIPFEVLVYLKDTTLWEWGGGS